MVGSLFDTDQAVCRSALRGLDLVVNSWIGVKVVTLPAGEDPDTYVRKEGPEAFARLEEQAPSLLDFSLEHCLSTAESGTIEGRIRSVDDVLRILQKSEHPIEREERIRVVAERLGISQQRLIERYPTLVQSEGRQPETVQSSGAIPATFKGASEERDLVYLLLHGHLTSADVQRLRPEAFSVPACRFLVEAALTHRDRDGRVGDEQIWIDLLLGPAPGAARTGAVWRVEGDDTRLKLRQRDAVLRAGGLVA